jgi:hypothetical protein
MNKICIDNDRGDKNKTPSGVQVGMVIGLLLVTIIAGSFIINAGPLSVLLTGEVLAYSGKESLSENRSLSTANETTSGMNGSIVMLPPWTQLELEDRRH